MATGSYLSIITLNVNGLSAPTKRQRLAEWIQKQDPYICCLQETHLKIRDTYRLKVKGWKKIFHTNRFTELGREGKGEGGDRGNLVEKKESPKGERAIQPVISFPSKNGY